MFDDVFCFGLILFLYLLIKILYYFNGKYCIFIYMEKMYKWWWVMIGDLLFWNVVNLFGLFWILYFLLYKCYLLDLYIILIKLMIIIVIFKLMNFILN